MLFMGIFNKKFSLLADCSGNMTWWEYSHFKGSHILNVLPFCSNFRISIVKERKDLIVLDLGTISKELKLFTLFSGFLEGFMHGYKLE